MRSSPVTDNDFEMDTGRLLRNEIQRYVRRFKDRFTADQLLTLEQVIRNYFDRNRNIQFEPHMVSICGPCVLVMETEFEAYLAFEQIMHHMDLYNDLKSIHERVSDFIALFRTLLPDLYNYFEDEEVLSGRWAVSWIAYLFTREMDLTNLVRLWDSYFGEGLDWEMHPFVCLAVLKHFKETLEELESSEISCFLNRLPVMDIDEIYQEAQNLKYEYARLKD
jgi:hypothetical protein